MHYAIRNMTPIRLILEVFTYALTLWLGLYLMARNFANLRLRYAGLGSVAYALTLAGDLLVAYLPSRSPPEGATQLWLLLARLHGPLLFLPALFWVRTMIELLPETHPWRERLRQGWLYGLLPVSLLFYLLGAGTSLIVDGTTENTQVGWAYAIFAMVVLLPLLGGLALVGQIYQAAEPKKPLGLLLAATLFFSLATGLLLFPFNWLSRTALLLAVGGDFVMLGFTIALLDAFEEGETLRPDFFRSLESSFFFVLLFGGLVAQTMALSTGVSFSMLRLLLFIIATAIITQIFADPIQNILDRFAFASSPKLQEARTELRVEASILPRIDDALDLDSLDEAEWKRLTRRALSNMGDLPRLATSPLARLPLVYARLSQKGQQDDTLERAAELKRLLTESIIRLKPPDKGDFGTSKEWRHYNALYFPYVVGLKPYSRRAIYDNLDSVEKEALEWFRSQVPNRTLYNWQSAAAKLVAQDLQERSKRF